jgi:hypothetical protein
MKRQSVMALAAILGGMLITSNSALAGDSFEQIRKLGKDTQDVVKHVARDDVKNTTRKTLDRPMAITSEDRSKPASPAHDRGAIDIRSNNISGEQRNQEARRISKNLGPNYNVVVEERGRGTQTNTTYNNGQQGHQRDVKPRATATHTHIQPNYGIRQP